MCLFLGLFGTSLPDVGSKDLATGGKDDMSTSMMSLELSASLTIYLTLDRLANNINTLGDFLIDLVKHALSNLNAINNVVFCTLDCKSSGIVLLTT